MKDYIIIPKRILLINYIWKIRVKPVVIHKGKRVNGVCKPNTRTIELSESSPDIRRTLFHELQHALCFEMNWTNTESVTTIGGDFWMSVFEQITPGGLNFDNPNAVEAKMQVNKEKQELLDKVKKATLFANTVIDKLKNDKQKTKKQEKENTKRKQFKIQKGRKKWT